MLRTLCLLALIGVAATPACTIYVNEPGAVMKDGSVYLGFHLYSGKGGFDREEYPIGQKHGAFRSLRLHADKGVEVNEVQVIFADGERWVAPAPGGLAQGQWSQEIVLPRGPRAIHSVWVGGKSQSKRLANVEIYGTR
jgi:hypothetical protein